MTTLKATTAMQAALDAHLAAQAHALQEARSGYDDPRRLALSRIHPDELEPVYRPDGFVDDGVSKRANVFRTLSIGEKPVLTRNQAAYGQKLIEIYAESQGAAGAPERPPLPQGRDDCGVRGYELTNDRRLRARDEYERILHFVGPTSADLLEAICRDWIHGDGRAVAREASGEVQIRWRAIVERVTGDNDRNRQSVYVRIACRDLERWFR